MKDPTDTASVAPSGEQQGPTPRVFPPPELYLCTCVRYSPAWRVGVLVLVVPTAWQLPQPDAGARMGSQCPLVPTGAGGSVGMDFEEGGTGQAVLGDRQGTGGDRSLGGPGPALPRSPQPRGLKPRDGAGSAPAHPRQPRYRTGRRRRRALRGGTSAFIAPRGRGSLRAAGTGAVPSWGGSRGAAGPLGLSAGAAAAPPAPPAPRTGAGGWRRAGSRCRWTWSCWAGQHPSAETAPPSPCHPSPCHPSPGRGTGKESSFRHPSNSSRAVKAPRALPGWSWGQKNRGVLGGKAPSPLPEPSQDGPGGKRSGGTPVATLPQPGRTNRQTAVCLSPCPLHPAAPGPGLGPGQEGSELAQEPLPCSHQGLSERRGKWRAGSGPCPARKR